MRMDLNNEYFRLWILINQDIKVISKGRSHETQSSGLTAAQFGVIWAIKTARRTPTLAEISRQLLLKPQAMTGLTRRMEKAGLITKEGKGGRGDATEISVTEKGEEAYEKASYSDIIPDAFSSLDETERAHLYDYLKRVRDEAMKSVASKYAVDVANLL